MGEEKISFFPASISGARLPSLLLLSYHSLIITPIILLAHVAFSSSQVATHLFNSTRGAPCLICEGEGENENSLRFLSVAPEITVPSQLYGVGPATDVTVSCRVQAYPSAINYWVKDQVIYLN